MILVWYKVDRDEKDFIFGMKWLVLEIEIIENFFGFENCYEMKLGREMV